MSNNKITEFIDTHLWQKGFETTDPEIIDGTLIVKYPAKGIGKLYLRFCLVQGDGCYKIPVGHEIKTKFEWRCS